MAIQLNCPSCDRKLFIPEAHAGRRVKCPGCAAEYVVPSGPAAHSEIPPRPVRRGTLTLLVATAVVGLAVAAAAWWFLHDRGEGSENPDDLAFIPGDARAFFSVRVAEAWDTPAVREALRVAGEQPNTHPPVEARLERLLGMRPEQVERFSFVIVDPSERLTWSVVRTSGRIDQQRLVGMLEQRRQPSCAGKRYHAGVHPQLEAVAMYFAGSQVLVFGPEEGVRRCLEAQAVSGRPGPLTPLLAMCEESHHAVGGMRIDPNLAAGKGVPPMLKGLVNTVLDVQRATLRLDVGAQTHVEVRAQFASEKLAEEMSRKLPTMIRAIKPLLPVLAVGMDAEPGRILTNLPPYLDGLKSRHEGTEVILEKDTDSTKLLEMLLQRP